METHVFFLVPREVSANSATVWMAAVDEPAQIALSLEPENLGIQTVDPWQMWPSSGKPRVRHREIRITGLEPRQSYQFALRAGGSTKANCKLTTLPSQLPRLGDGKPFTVLLG